MRIRTRHVFVVIMVALVALLISDTVRLLTASPHPLPSEDPPPLPPAHLALYPDATEPILPRPTDPLVVIGVSGVTSADLADLTRYPALAARVGAGALANQVVRGTDQVACPVDGWLMLQTGHRVGAPAAPAGTCLSVADAVRHPLAPHALQSGDDTSFGLLKRVFEAFDVDAGAIGPGAQLALGTPDQPAAGVPAPADDDALALAVAEASHIHRVTVVDADLDAPTLPVRRTHPTASVWEGFAAPPAGPNERAGRLLARIDRVLAALDPQTQVIVTSLADGDSRSRLQAAIVQTSAVPNGLARSGSTRTDGLVLTVDLTQAILRAAGLPETPLAQGLAPGARGASPLPLSLAESESPRALTEAHARLSTLADQARHARVTLSVQPVATGLIGVCAGLVGIFVVAVALRGGLTSLSRGRHRALVAATAWVASLPVATFLANLVPWWRLTLAGALAALLALTAVIAAALTGCAWASGRLARGLAPGAAWTRWVPLITLTGIHTVLLAAYTAFPVTTSDAVLGSSTLLGARFYGIGNSQFTLLALATLWTASLLGALLVGAGYRLLGVIAAAAGGMWVVSIDGGSTLGADVGGPLALTPGVLVLTIMLLRRRVRWPDVLWIGALTFGILAHFGLRDVARPAAERSHAGNFVAAIATGRAGEAVLHKLHGVVATFVGSPAGIVGTVAIVCVGVSAWAIVRIVRARHARAAISQPSTFLGQIPGAAALAAGVTVTVLIGMVVNDSGLLVATVGLLLGVPLLALSVLTAAGEDDAPLRLPSPRGAARLALVALLAGASVATVIGGPQRAGTSAGDLPDSAPTVLVVTHSLTWDALGYAAREALDADASHTWRANLIPLRTAGGSCPLDAFLAINAGALVSPLSLGGQDLCLDLPLPDADAKLPGWDYVRAGEQAASRTQRLGALGDALTKAGLSTHAIGGNAAAVLATSQGTVAGTWERSPLDDTALAQAAAASTATHALTVVDAAAISLNVVPQRLQAAIQRTRTARVAEVEEAGGTSEDALAEPITSVRAGLNPLPEDGGESARAFEERYSTLLPTYPVNPAETGQRDTRVLADLVTRQRERLQAVLDALPPEATVLAVSTTPAGMGRAMGVALLRSPAVSGGLASSASVRQPGMVQVPDIGVTLARTLGLTASDLVSPAGAPLQARTLPVAEQWSQLISHASRASTIQSTRGAFYTPLRTVAVVVFLLAAVGTIAAVSRQIRLEVPGGRASLGFLARVVCLTLAAQPFSVQLVSLAPWWQADSPAAVIGAAPWVISGLLALTLLAASRHPAGPLVALSAGTAVILLVAIGSGSRTLIDAPLGFNSLAGARFYGAGNEAYTLLATAFFMAAGVGAAWLVRRGRRLLGVGGFVVAGLVVAIIDGAPRLGADFGGPISLLPGLAITAIMLSGAGLSVRKVVVALGLTGLVSFGVAVGDWLRPPASRTHLGRFVDSALSGDAWPILARKLGANLSALTWSGYRWVLLAALVLALTTLAYGLRRRPLEPPRGRGARWRALRASAWGWLAPAYPQDAVPTVVAGLRAVLIGWGCTEFLAFALNDSGILLPGLAAILAVPLLLDALVATRLAQAPRTDR